MRMFDIEINFIKLSENAIMPQYGREGDAGLDLFTAETIRIAPHETIVIPTDIAISLPFGYEATVRPRSGNSLNGVKGCNNLSTIEEIPCQPYLRVILGTIDSNYRGNIGIITYNQENYEVEIPKGTKLAQLVISPVSYVKLNEIKKLDEANRNNNGFGSSDK